MNLRKYHRRSAAIYLSTVLVTIVHAQHYLWHAMEKHRGGLTTQERDILQAQMKNLETVRRNLGKIKDRTEKKNPKDLIYDTEEYQRGLRR